MGKLSNYGTVFAGLLCSSALFFAQDVAQAVSTSLPTAAESPAGTENATSSISQVRIVRLSQIRGKVEMERSASLGFNATFANLPVVQGARLRSHTGIAEVEFEDNSTLRITPDSSLDFTELGRNNAGATTNKVRLVSGTLYVSLVKSKETDFQVKVGDQTVTLQPSTHLRLDVYPSGSELTVFHGKAVVTTNGVERAVSSGKVLKLGQVGMPAANLEATSAREEEPGLYDQWDQQQKEQHDVRVGNSFAGSPYSYGLSDLNYYGSFSNVGGCGQMWQPYFVSSAWDPYASGIWAYYPGAGYSWVSPYPWGWAPFHSGNWVNCPGTGWGWQPGQNWSGLQNVTTLNPIHRPLQPHPPAGGQPGLVPVNLALLRSSRLLAGDRVEFAKDSAGLGVPRDLGVNLRKPSQTVAARGVAQSRIEYADVLQQTSRSIGPPSGTTRSADGRTAAMEHPVSRPVAVRSYDGSAGSFGAGNRGGPVGNSSISSRSAGPVNSPGISTRSAPAPSMGSAPAPSGGSHH